MKKVSVLVNMFDALCLSPASRTLLGRVLAKVAARNECDKTFFQKSDGVKDYLTDVEYLGQPLHVLTKVTKVSKYQRSRTIST